MDYQLLPFLVVGAIVVVVATLVVALLKIVHRTYLRFQGIRTARYTAAVGQMLHRQMLPAHLPRDWAHDVLFQETLAEYRLSGTESEMAFIDTIVDRLGVRVVLRKRMYNRVSVSRRFRAASVFIDLATSNETLELRRLLDERSHHIAVHAAKGLSRLGEIASVPAILRRTEGASEWHAARFADALLGFGPEAGVPIRAWIRRSVASGGSAHMISLAIQILGHIRDPGSEGLLIEMLDSQEPEWRVKAATGLGSLGTAKAVSALVHATSDEYWPVRAKAATSLGRLGDPVAAEALRALLNDHEWWVRQNAAAAIAELPGGGPMLVDVLSGDDPFAADAAMYRLSRRGDVQDSLVQTLNGTDGTVEADLVVNVRFGSTDTDFPFSDLAQASG